MAAAKKAKEVAKTEDAKPAAAEAPVEEVAKTEDAKPAAAEDKEKVKTSE